jgi:hypothetical protein
MPLRCSSKYTAACQARVYLSGRLPALTHLKYGDREAKCADILGGRMNLPVLSLVSEQRLILLFAQLGLSEAAKKLATIRIEVS